MNKKVVLFAVLLVLGGATFVLAETSAQPTVLEVNPNGKVLLRGTIDSVSAGSITVKSWGGSWTVNISSATQLLPAKLNNDITQFKTGDFVGVQGKVSQLANWTIDATLVRSWVPGLKTEKQDKEKEKPEQLRLQNNPQEKPGVQQQIQAILEQIKKIQTQIGTQQGQ